MSIQAGLKERAYAIAEMARTPDQIKAAQRNLSKAVQDGTLPSYVGIPLISELNQKMAKASAPPAAPMQQPPIAQQVMQQAQADQGVPALPSGLPTEMAGGGIVAFSNGGVPDASILKELLQGEEDESDDDLNELVGMFQKSMELPEMPEAPQQETAETPASLGISSLADVPEQSETTVTKTPHGFSAERTSRRDTDGISQLKREKADVSAFGDKFDKLRQFVLGKESGGRRFDKEGNLLTSSKGAEGEMQVMRATQSDPGFGVTPARDRSPDEIARVGIDYLRAMRDRYGSDKLAAIAYNMGPGATDKWLASGADISRLPEETRNYIKGMAGGGTVNLQGTIDLGGGPQDGPQGANGYGAAGSQINSAPMATMDVRQGMGGAIPAGILGAMRGMGFAGGGAVHFQNRGIVGALPSDDYLDTGIIPGTTLEDRMRIARGEKPEVKPRKLGQLLPGFTERIMAPEAPIPLTDSTFFADKMREASGGDRAAATAEPGRAQLAPVNPQRNAPMTVTGPGDTYWGRDLGKENPFPRGPEASANMRSRIDALGSELDAARQEVQDLLKRRPSLRSPGQDDWQAKFAAASARRDNLQTQYEKTMEATGMGQAAFGVPPKGALAPVGSGPAANPFIQSMSTPQAPRPAKAAASAGAGAGEAAAPTGPSALDVDEENQRLAAEQARQAEAAQYAAQDIESGPGVAGAAGAAGAAAGAAGAAAGAPTVESALEKLLAKREGKIAQQEETNKYLSLLQAGLGMMGGTSPHAFANIGQGAMQGVGTYAALAKQQAADENALLSGRISQERYKQLENYRQQQLEGLEAYRQATLGQKESQAKAAEHTKLTGQLGAMEGALRRAAIAKIGMDKLGSLEPQAQQLAIDAEVTNMMRSPRSQYRSLFKQAWGYDPFEGVDASQTAAPVGTYDPQSRKLTMPK
jgi:hypothetical protein